MELATIRLDCTTFDKLQGTGVIIYEVRLYTVLLKLFSQLIGGCLGVIVYIQVVSIAKQLLIATGSSAGVERIFSSFGLVHSKLRNSVGIVKAENWRFCSNC